MSQPRRTEWPQDALELFAQYAGHREPHRPLECNQGTLCWVRDGPPSMAKAGTRNRCAGCRGSPRSLDRRRRDAAGRLLPAK